MSQPPRAVRLSGTDVWHCEPGCPDFPNIGNTEVQSTVPEGETLCVYCATRGSGSRDLDDRAAAVLRVLRRDARLRDAGLRAERVTWAFGDAAFVFAGAGASQPKRVSRATLTEARAAPLADSIARHLTREAKPGQ